MYVLAVVLLAGYGHDVTANLHLVGHSLGAHVVGFIAKKVQALGLGKLPRLTGLDPAYPFFELAGPEGRVDKTDAELVQIVHTNSGWLWEGCLSFKVMRSLDHFKQALIILILILLLVFIYLCRSL